jgi:hypothetical protein
MYTDYTPVPVSKPDVDVYSAEPGDLMESQQIMGIVHSGVQKAVNAEHVKVQLLV